MAIATPNLLSNGNSHQGSACVRPIDEPYRGALPVRRLSEQNRLLAEVPPVGGDEDRYGQEK